MIPYRIIKIETKQFAIFPEKFINGNDVDIQTSYNFDIRSDMTNIRCTSAIHFLQKGQLIMILELTCYFDIASEGVDFIKEQKKVPLEFLRYMATITVGTARGIIHAKTEGTVLCSIILPPINLVEAIKSDMDLQEISN
jgi:hypothetical protein